MCGRMIQSGLRRKAEQEERLLLDKETRERIQDRYNLAPTQEALTVSAVDGQWVAAIRPWGIRNSTSSFLINSRDDTMAAKPRYFDSFQRIMVPVSGFYEWPHIGARKRAFCIRPAAPEDTWWFAGLAKEGEGFTVMTTTPTPMMAELHSRWPVILRPEDRGLWLDPSTKRADLLALMRPGPDDEVDAYEVGSAVGDVKNEGPDLMKRVG